MRCFLLAGAATVAAWGGLGHIATAFVASHFVANATRAHLQALLADPTDAYLAGVATWADSVKYTRWGRFSRSFHFIDAADTPPAHCSVDFARDCPETGCVVSALANYTRQALDPLLDARHRAVAAKFIVHFIADMHQPLHAENLARGGNAIPVLWHGHPLNLHHVWDSSIAEKWLAPSRARGPYAQAREWAADLAHHITSGRYAAARDDWLRGISLDDPVATSMEWVRQSNAYICSTVLPDGPEAILGQELSGAYYDKAAPVVELQVARGGYRMAAWLDLIVDSYTEWGQEL